MHCFCCKNVFRRPKSNHNWNLDLADQIPAADSTQIASPTRPRLVEHEEESISEATQIRSPARPKLGEHEEESISEATQIASSSRGLEVPEEYSSDTQLAASSSSSTSSSSSSVSKLKSYDVFLSFRGADTRNNFTDHLYHALNKMGVDTFRDTERLEQGEPIAPSLLRAIEESKFAVVVFSKNYASSKWCLDELAHIAKCEKESGLEVFPVFFHVEASEVRWQQKGKFREAFEKHEQRYRDNMEMVTNWRIALREIAALSGWDVQNRGEAEVIQEIAELLSDKIYTLPSANRNLVGMDRRIEMLEYFLNLKSSDVLTIGIWGMGGIGKTALAEEVFNRIRKQFDISGFVPNVRSVSKEANGLVNLQKRLCESFNKYRNINIETVGMGVTMLRRVLCKRKVIIILDDVDDVKQIEFLAAGRNDCWGPGSRLIITSRNRCTFEDCGRIYDVPTLNDEEASQLLCSKAFKQNHAPGDFVELSNNLVLYTRGLPLALEVLGSYLSHKKKLDEWEAVLHRLYEYSESAIFGVLQISYDGLRDAEKKIFLDTACFFKGEDCARVKKIWKRCGFYPKLGIRDLIDKALIRIERKTLWMHDLLQQMGWNIVLQESEHEPGKRTRLCHYHLTLWNDWDDWDDWDPSDSWLCKDVRSVLKENKGTSAVEGIFLGLPKSEEIWLRNGDPFLNMSNLRLLNIRNVNFRGVHFGYLSNQLRLLEWHECPLESLPPSFEPDQLVEFKIPNSCIKQLWNERLSLEMLLLMDVSNCRYLTKTPNFSTVPHLEKLILEGCETLSEVHPTIGRLQHLVLLNLKGCIRLKSLPHSIRLRSLQTFTLSGCSKLEMFPEIEQNMETLSELYLDGTAICELPTSIQNLSGLILLNLSGCRNLLGLPRGIFSSLTSLKFLYLSLCSSMDELPEDIDRLEHLEELDACHTAITKVPQSVSLLKNLKLLCFHGCKGASTVARSESIGLQLPSSFSGLSCLTSLNLGQCDLAEGSISDDIGCLSSLQSLDLSENNFVSIPESISQLSELAELSLFRCSKLQSLPKKLPSSLKVDKRHCPMLPNSSNDLNTWASCTGLSITNCRTALLTRLPHLNKYSLQYLERLDLSNCQCMINIPDFSQVPNLMELILQGCSNLSVVHPSIMGLQHLVSLNLKGCVSLESLHQHIHLKSLRTLILSGCSNLHVFPEIEGDMESLSHLYLDGTAIRELPISMRHLKGLTLLNLRGCKNLSTIPHVVFWKFESLKYLYMSGCSLIDQLPISICTLPELVVLDVSESGIREVPRFIGYLKKLKVLSLNGCGLAEGAIPCEIEKLYFLERLDLSENNFLSLPDVFSRLSRLRELWLSRCTKLQSLPMGLPLNLKLVHARDCPMLKSYANILTIWDSGFRFLYFGKSNEEENQRIHVPLPVPVQDYESEPTSSPFLVIREDPIDQDQSHQTHFRFPVPKDDPIDQDWIYLREPFEIRFSHRTTIPNWWSEWNNSGSSVKIQLSDNNGTWIGFSILVVFEILKSENFVKRWEEEQIFCHFQTDADCLENPLVFQNFSEFEVGSSYGLCFYEPRGGQFGGVLNESNLLLTSISTSSPCLMVRGCGIHLISSQQDAAEFVQNLTKYLNQQLDLNSDRH